MTTERLTDEELDFMRREWIGDAQGANDRRQRMLAEHSQLTRDLAAAAARESRLREERDEARRDAVAAWRHDMLPSEQWVPLRDRIKAYGREYATDRKEG